MYIRARVVYAIILAAIGVLLILQVFFGTAEWLFDLISKGVGLVLEQDKLILDILVFIGGVVCLIGAYDEIKSIRKNRQQFKKVDSAPVGSGRRFGDWGG